MEKHKKTKGFGIAGLICGILSIVLFMAPYFGFPLAILGFVFAIVHANKHRWDGFAVGALITSIIGGVINLAMGLFVFALFGIAAT